MSDDSQNLTLFEASAIITGYGVGGGIMAVPYLMSLNNIFISILIMLVAYFVSVLLHLMIAELCSKEDGTQIVEIYNKYLFSGKYKNLFTWVFFILMVIMFYTNLSAYITGAGEILNGLFNIPMKLAILLFFAVSAGIVAFGLKGIGVSEKYSIIAILIFFLILAFSSIGLPVHPLDYEFKIGKETLALFGMIMFCFASFFSVPQAVEGLSWNKKLIKKAVYLGIGTNFAFILLSSIPALLVSEEITKVSIIGWSKALGTWAEVIGSIIILLAMLTSYWSISYALAVIIQERLNWNYRQAWFTASIPTLILSFLDLTDFMGFMRLAGGGIALLVALTLIPTYRNYKNENSNKLDWNMGKLGSTPFQIIVFIGYVLMAIGSAIPIP